MLGLVIVGSVVLALDPKANYAINPTPEPDLRSNRAILPARVIAALDIMTKVVDKLVVERESWSDPSKRSTRYDYAEVEYSDARYNCQSCGVLACFSAQDQKVAFEVEGKYIRQGRTLCESCFKECRGLLSERRALIRALRGVRISEVLDHDLLSKLMEVLLRLPKYGIRPDLGNLAALGKVLRRDV